MNSRSFENRKYFSAGSELKILDGLPGNKRHDLESDINYNSRQHAGGNKRDHLPAKMVSRATLVRTAFFERHILAPNADIEMRIVDAGIRRCQLCGSDLEHDDAASPR
jgi:hypothetical protein